MRPSPFGSVRVRTTVFATVVVATALLVAAAALVLLQRRSMIDGIDTSASNRAKDLSALVRGGALPRTVAVGKEDDAFRADRRRPRSCRRGESERQR